MDNKEILKQQEEKMKLMYGEPCHLLKGMAVAFLMEVIAFGVLVGVGYLLSFL